MRKGYLAEYQCKKKLIEEFGKENVIKVAIGGSTDFLVLEPGSRRIAKIVEVKQTKKNRWYPTDHDIQQFEMIKKLSKDHGIPVEYWIKIKRKWEVLRLEEVEERFIRYSKGRNNSD